jgi:hypothetical protein
MLVLSSLIPPRLTELFGLHKEVKDTALVFCSLMETIDGTSDPSDVAKIEMLIAAAVTTFEETPLR